MSDINKHIYISAGEASGDLLGADLARALLQKNPTLRLTGMGGQRMLEAGVDIQFSSDSLSVVGIVEIITKLPRIVWAWFKIKKYLRSTKPHLVILIDFPDTHFRFFKTAKKLNIPILYYVSPQIWAWRFNRIKQIQKYVDHMAVLFQFEEKIYRDAGIPVTFVGHPLGTIAKPNMLREAAYSFFKLKKDHPIIALFPGSRSSELKNHLSLILESAREMRNRAPHAQFALVLAPHFNRDQITLPPDMIIVQNNLYDLLQITNAAVAVSGTVTLEIALMNVPQCIIYRINPITFWIAKKIVRTNYIGLCNIVAEQLVAKEFIQSDATSDRIAAEVNRLLESPSIDYDLKNKVIASQKNASQRVAEIALGMI